ncbi:MAG: peptidoglycan DD-metalloendopeptidase family protein [Pseudomonadota bacterium]|nr:peptidoglycan DD-metalloendopeptidase family protein [Pseudomonadota bacterium]
MPIVAVLFATNIDMNRGVQVTTEAGATTIALSIPEPSPEETVEIDAPNSAITMQAVPSTLTQTHHPETPLALSDTSKKQREQTAPASSPASQPAPTEAPNPIQAASSNDSTETDLPWVELEVRPGDSLSGLFKRENIAATEWMALTQLRDHGKYLSRLYPGDVLRVQRDEEGQILALAREIDEQNTLEVLRVDGQFESRLITRPVERRQRYASGTIDHSLFVAGRDAGLSDNLVMELAGIFAWDVDFVLDIRRGDSFTVIYEELYRDGNKLRDGDILAAEFRNRNRVMRAIRYTDADERTSYYTPEGLSLRKAFLRTPVDFTRISSRFDLSRKHPVLNTIRAHKGVDYAAPRGTPVKAAGDGKVVFRGTKGGYGKVVTLQHGGNYSTLYAHLHNFARGIKTGGRVRQGQIIGYVGSTGLATGPHLHYEFRVNGQHKDPLRVKLPDALPLPKQYRADFSEAASPLLAQLDTLNRSQIASNEE